MSWPKMLGGFVCCALGMACAGAGKQVTKPSAQQQAKTNGKAVAKEDPRVVCRMERPTGSNIPERVCRFVDRQSDESMMRTQDMLRNSQSHTGTSPQGN